MQSGRFRRIGILGAGAWGTALAITVHRAGRDVILQAYEPEVAEAINRDHQNPLYLAGVRLDPEIQAVVEPRTVLDADAVLVVVPAQHLRSVLQNASPDWREGVPAIICAKGIENKTGALMSQVAESTLPVGVPVAALTGPSFAIEVARELPTAVTFASRDANLRHELPAAIGTPRFRIYSCDDVVGAEIGGAVKNVLAIACGIVAGRRLGDNARAALITRGLAEMTRLAISLGARPETLMGLSGLGDLVLTCNAMQSRNFSLGVALGEGRTISDILAERRSVTEGVHSAASVTSLACRLGVSMPICAAADAVLNKGADLDETIAGLLARPFKEEAVER
ncbi:MAG: NAD(P)-dependent glycerol-3-phosphate dehydrogenase [Hyphomicrobiales bacterium]|nr:NAD(P)-dependent glycerol-3-phosphate dehydrogenase [Hyphomicrobiales bacterium]